MSQPDDVRESRARPLENVISESSNAPAKLMHAGLIGGERVWSMGKVITLPQTVVTTEDRLRVSAAIRQALCAEGHALNHSNRLIGEE